MDRVEAIARTIARRRLLRALGVARPSQDWGPEFTAHIERAIERTYPDHLYMADEIVRALPDAGFALVPRAPNEAWIVALDERHMVNDQASPGGPKLTQMIQRVLATAPTHS